MTFQKQELGRYRERLDIFEFPRFGERVLQLLSRGHGGDSGA